MPGTLDRTLEFRAILSSRQAQRQQPPVAPPPPRVSAHAAEFASRAAAIGGEIHKTVSKLRKLTQLAQSKSLFDDPEVEINELTHIIKQEITTLNANLTGLQQTLSQAQAAGSAGGFSRQRAAHSSSVVDALKTQLFDATSEFKEVLHTRSHNIQLLQGRREQLAATPQPADGAADAATGGSSGAGGGSGLPPGGSFGGGGGGAGTPQHNQLLRSRFAPPAPIFELAPPPQAAGGGGSAGGGGFFGGGGGGGSNHKKDDDAATPGGGGGGGGGRGGFGGGGGGGPLWATPGSKPAGMRSADAEGGEVVIDMEAAMGGFQTQAQRMQPSDYLHSRAAAVDSVQSTIAELGGIFQQLAEMVSVQGSQLQRVDENVDEALLNTQQGYNQLQRYMKNLQSNRGLVLRLFAILLFFIVLWGTFFA
jgi:syntaxin 5